MTTSTIHPQSIATEFCRCDVTLPGSSISQESIRSLREVEMEKDSGCSSYRRIARHWKMIIIILIPVLSLMSLATNSLLKAAKVKKASENSIHKVKAAHLYANLIQMLQRERGISSTYLSTSGDRYLLLDTMLTARKNTDLAFARIPPNHLAINLYGISHTIVKVQESIHLSREKIENGSVSVQDHLTFYTKINNGLLSIMFNDVRIPGEWNCVLDIVAFTALIRWTDVIGLLSARIAFQYATCEFSSEALQNHLFLTGEARGYKNIFTQYNPGMRTAFSLENQNTERYLEEVINSAWSESFLNSCKTKAKEDRLSLGLTYFQNMTKLIDYAFEIQQLKSKDLTGKMLEIRKDAEFQFNIYLTVEAIITTVSIILTIWYILCNENVTFKIANNAVIIKSKAKELDAEKKVTERLQYQMLSKKIATGLKEARTITTESFENVTIFISDIMNFTELETRSTARQIIDLLNDLYGLFDSEAEKYDVHKIETFGDSYMLASGVPDRNGSAHALHICNLALDLHDIMKRYHVPFQTFERNEFFKIRIGIHSGPCVAGVLGLKIPRYCLFGETVNIAKRLKSTGRGGKIHISSKTYQLIKETGHFTALERGNVMIKGKGSLKTFWLGSSAQNANAKICERD
ncbi:uncharacterized protein LOC133193901 [Saccostrea echinata]|uniref:uncharacterized protein LOC133193901 n=1 Tax=Saccostrea echinata TaxID=191078 RepID=UPI002A81A73C|nr:uncharacterized protein LOC133193901 [Saccostrea echinata]